MLFYIKNSNLLIITICAFLLYQYINYVYFPINTGYADEDRILNSAINFANTGEFISRYRAWEMPLTAIVYGSIYWLCESAQYTIIIVRLFQSILLLIQAILMSRISLIIFQNYEVSIVTYIIMLYYPFFIYYQALLLSENIFITLLIASFYYLYLWYNSNFTSKSYFILTNLLFGLTIYSKSTLTILPPCLISIFYLSVTKDIKNTGKILLYAITIFMFMLSVWWIRNYKIFDRIVFLTTNGGETLYLGANKNNITGGASWDKDVDIEFVKNTRRSNNELLINETFKAKAIQFIVSNPMSYVKLMWLKFKRFYNFTFNSDKFNSIYYNLLSIFSYGICLILSIITFLKYTKLWRILSPIIVLILYFTMLHILVIASIRYRLPIEPFIILLASKCVVDIKNYILIRIM